MAMTANWRSLGALPLRAAAELFPGYFSMVMATGTLSIAAGLLGYPGLAEGLVVVNLAAYGVLAFLSVLRFALYLPRVAGDLADPARGPGFFTAVAGTCVLGSQLALVAGWMGAAGALWILGICLWIAITYGFFFAMIIRELKPGLAASINGAWLIAAVATQGVSVLGSITAPASTVGGNTMLFAALATYLLGAALYVAIIMLIVYRLVFVPVRAEDLAPTYWINMGAVAISTLAGSMLVLHAGEWPFLVALLPFIKGLTLLFWVVASWWIPLLLLLMIWRHVWKRVPIRYEPRYWGLAFPLAMYTTATLQLARAEHLEFLLPLADAFFVAAAAVWVLAASGLLRSIVRGVRSELSVLAAESLAGP